MAGPLQLCHGLSLSKSGCYQAQRQSPAVMQTSVWDILSQLVTEGVLSIVWTGVAIGSLVGVSTRTALGRQKKCEERRLSWGLRSVACE